MNLLRDARRLARPGVVVLMAWLVPGAVTEARADAVWSPFPGAPPPALGPAARHGEGMVFDPVNHQCVVFGGYRTANPSLSLADTWVGSLDPTLAFDSLEVAGPSARFGAATVYDPVRQRMLVFSGNTGNGTPIPLDAWALDLSGGPPSWSQLATTTTPAGRQGAGVAYDSARDRFLLFGGFSGGASYTNTVWVFTPGSPSTWSTLATTGGPPAGRNYAATIYDPVRDLLVVTGGNGGGATLSDTWILNLSATPAVWQNVPTAAFQRFAAASVYDPIGDRMILFGGYSTSGGFFNDTWALSLGFPMTWTQIATANRPWWRHSMGSAYDSDAHRMLIFGGDGGGSLDDLWALSLDGPLEWTALIGMTPLSRYGFSMEMDPPRHRAMAIGYGGLGIDAFSTWSLDLGGGAPWSRYFTPGGYPGGVLGTTLNYVEAEDVMYEFGGAYFDPDEFQYHYFGSLIRLTLSGTPSMTTVTTFGTPPSARHYGTTTLDPARNRLVVFGGLGAGNVYRNDVYTYDLATQTWTYRPSPGEAPAPRAHHQVVYDPINDRYLLFGGFDPTHTDGDLWALDPVTFAWTLLPTTGGPGPRRSHSMVYDPLKNAVLMFGGHDGVGGRNDTWRLSFDPIPVWTAVATTGALPPARYAHDMVFDLENRRLVVHGGVGFNDTWQLTFEPEAVSADPTASAAAFALRGFVTNPARSGLDVAFALPDAAPATLELLDVAGRRIASRDVGGMGAGRHRVRMADHAIAPGVYFVRLTRGNRSLIARGVHLH